MYCHVAIVDDGKLQAVGDSSEFWVIFGGFAPIGKKVMSDDDVIPDRTPGKLYSIAGGQVADQIEDYSKSSFENDKCYLIYCFSLGTYLSRERTTPIYCYFQPMVLLKGGLSSSYICSIAEKGVDDETYSPDSASIIRISGTAVHNNKAVHLDPVASSLNSHECFVVHAGSHLYIWQGTQSTYEQQQWAAKIADFLKPGVTAKYQKEGTESATFWLGLGGKGDFTSSKAPLDSIRDPHLFGFSLSKGYNLILHVFWSMAKVLAPAFSFFHI